MWILEVRAAGATKKYLLVGGVTYSIGRKECDILLPVNDASVSRTHATITVVPSAASDLADLSTRPSILLGDVSKHGTFVNKQRLLAVEKKRELSEGDEIIFGRTVSASLQFAPAIVTASDSLSKIERADLIATVCKLGGYLSLSTPFSIDDVIKARLSPFVFLYVTNEVSMEPSAMMAMMDRYCLVNIMYPLRLYETVRDGCTIDLGSLPQPGGFDAPRQPLLAKAPYCRPDPSMFDAATFRTTDHRAHGATFRLVHFVFLDLQLYERMLPVIHHGGGTASFVDLDRVARWRKIDRLADGEPNPLPLRGLVDDLQSHGLNSYVAVPSSDFDEVLSCITSGEGQLSAGSATSHRAAYVKLWSSEVPLIHCENMLLAVYSEDTPSQLAPNAPGVLVKKEMTFVPDEEDKDSAATEEGILPANRSLQYSSPNRRPALSAKLSQPQPIMLVPAEQLFEKPRAAEESPRRRSPSAEGRLLHATSGASFALVPRSPSRRGGGAAAQGGATADLYQRWTSFNESRHEERDLSLPSTLRKRQERIARTVSPVQRTFSPVAIRTPTATLINASPENRILTLCNEFSTRSLPFLEQQVQQTCNSAFSQNYVTPTQKTALETALHRVQTFKSTLSSLKLDMRNGPLSESTTHRVEDVSRRVDYLLSSIQVAMSTLKLSSAQKPTTSAAAPRSPRVSSPARSGTSSPSRARSPTTRNVALFPRGSSPVVRANSPGTRSRR